MQQTEKYQLNLIETSDTFSPAPLNENMEKVEAAIIAGDAAEAEARTEADAALDARVSVLELHKFTYGYYIGNSQKLGDPQVIPLPFTPVVVLLDQVCTMRCLSAMSTIDYPNEVIEIVPGGFKVSNRATDYVSPNANLNGTTYRYIAFG